MRLSKKQKEYIRCANKRWGFKVGAVRSGKSYVDTAFVIPYRMRQVADKPGLVAIFGVSSQTIERNVLEPMREIYGKNLVGSIRSGLGTAMVFGEEVYCIGCEKANAVNRIRGLSLKYAYGDEIAGWNKDVFSMIGSRLDKDYSRFDGACNPEGPSHWFKKWLDTPNLDAYIQHYVLFDNPFLPRSFIDSLCNEYMGTVYYDRYILGEWALAEGLIYPMYKDALAEPPEGAELTSYLLSVDYGTENAFAALLWAQDARTKVWYGLKEYYYSGRTTGVPKTDEEYADELEEFTAPVLKQYADDYQAQLDMDDPFANRRRLLTIVDPSAASFITTLQKRKGFRVKKADNDVSDGIRDVAVSMKNGWIKINPGMKNTLEELEGYAWDDKHPESGEDKPVKVKDHACDAMRYFVRTMHIVEKGRKGQKPMG